MNTILPIRYISLSGILIVGLISIMSFTSRANPKNIGLKNRSINEGFVSNSAFSDLETLLVLPYFPKIYSGVGIEHMNINLVNLKMTGLKAGDEIGVFDGKYCVGSGLITELHILDNSINIPSSANDSIMSSPNGFIDGHKISLKVYRSGKVYQLYFQTVNNSQDVFESRGSMFALVDFSKSTGNRTIENHEFASIFPNPFSTNLTIRLQLIQTEKITIEIVDLHGKSQRTIHSGIANGEFTISWDGKDNFHNQVPHGIYLCKINQTSYRILYLGNGFR